jgi:hypothetical protein
VRSISLKMGLDDQTRSRKAFSELHLDRLMVLVPGLRVVVDGMLLCLCLGAC